MLADHGAIAAIGLENLVVIKTDDAVLVSHRSRTQEVREIVDHLKSSKKELATAHSTVRRPWGSFTVLEDAESYKIKRISVDPGQKLSLQKHRYRAEHWTVIQGIARVTCGDKEITLKTNESIDIPQGTVHRLANETSEPLQIVEVQTGSYFGEDDIVRLQDDYGRVN